MGRGKVGKELKLAKCWPFLFSRTANSTMYSARRFFRACKSKCNHEDQFELLAPAGLDSLHPVLRSLATVAQLLEHCIHDHQVGLLVCVG